MRVSVEIEIGDELLDAAMDNRRTIAEEIVERLERLRVIEANLKTYRFGRNGIISVPVNSKGEAEQ